jgi:3-oxoacyl-[acyl-carrier-protein] synthase II
MKKRVVITGIGAISPLGIGIEENWKNLKNGKQAIKRIKFQGGDVFPHTFCGVVNEFNPSEFIQERKIFKLMNREAQMAAGATRLAIEDARLDGYYPSERIGLYLGTGLTSGELGDLIPLVENSIDEMGNFSYKRLGSEALPNCNPLLSFKILTNMPLCYISILFQIKGPNLVFNPWAGKTAQAVGEGMRAIQQGEIDCAVVGGCDSKSHFIGFLTFTKLGLLSKKGISCPFDKRRDGIILSEGACILILEDWDNAVSRNRKPYAELSGYATTTDTSSEFLVSKNPEVLKEAMTRVISEADLSVDDIDFICAGANSHPIGDLAEAQAIESVFGRKRPFVNSIKSATGDMLAAAAPFELAMCAISLQEGILPPQINLEKSDGDIRLQLCRNKSEKKDIKAAISNSFELGSAKVSLALRRYS